MEIRDFKIGCDPELFVTRKGNLISAHETCIKGTKQEPFKVQSGAVQIDGTALEFNTDPVSLVDFDAFNNNVVSVMRQMKELVGEDIKFRIKPSVTFDEKYWETIPEENKELGCNPDWNAYTMAPNPSPDASKTMRTAAGHIHIGWGEDIPVDHPEHLVICAGITKMFDMFVGLGTLLFDSDTERRSLYGRAGAFRPKPYGFEYRVPSNAWLTSKARRKFIFTCAQKAIWAQLSGRGITTYILNNPARSYLQEDLLQEVINTSNVAWVQQHFSFLTGINSNGHSIR